MARNGNETTTKFNVDISQLKKGIQDAKRQISLANSEFKASASALENWKTSTKGVGDKLRQLGKTLKAQESILDNLEQQYRAVADAEGENSEGAEKLKIAINNQRTAINKTQKDIDKYEKVLSDLNDESKDVADDGKKASKTIKEIGDSAEKSEGKTSKLAKSLGGALKKGLAGLVTAGAGAVAGFLASGEATQEFTEDMGKLETAFKTSGHTVDTAKKSYREMVGILGETDQSVEAVNHLAKLTKSEKELAKWTDISAGVYATFGDSLPLEGLTEAANETAKVGEVTGPLADALNWAGKSEEEFNRQLAKCNSESERATLITDTLNGIYKEAGKEYQKVNGDLIANRQATSDMNEAMAEMGKVAMPITTALKQGFADLLKTMLPSITQIGDAIRGMMDGTKGASDQLKQGLEGLFTGILGKVNEMLPTILNVGLSIITSLIQGIVQAIPEVVNTLAEIIPQITQGILSLIPQLIPVWTQIYVNIAQALGDLLPKIVSQVIEIVPQIVDALAQAIPKLIEGAIQFFNAIILALPSLIQSLMTALPKVIDTIINALTTGIPLLIDGAITLLMSILDALPVVIDALITNLPTIINTIITGLITGLPLLLDASVKLLMALIDAIPKIIVMLAEALPNIIITIIDTLLANTDKLLQCSITLFMTLVKAIPKIIVGLGKAIPKIIVAIIKGLGKLIPKLISFNVKVRAKVLSFFAELIKKASVKTGEFVSSIINKVKELPSLIAEKLKGAISKVADFGNNLKEKGIEAGKKFVSSLKDKIKSLPDDIKSIGKNIVTGMWTGINDKFDWLTGKIKGFTKGVTDKLKGFFGIHSPSRVMRDEVGKYLAFGIADGIAKNKSAVDNAMKALANDVSNPINFDTRKVGARVASNARRYASGNAGKGSESNSYTFNQYNTSPKALSRLEIYRQTRNQLNFAKGV